jgi:EAL domain-containing protein (putative c-di-GMP-specific phosphodiesterase class I)/CheY-like chemotaxis protein
MSDDHRQPRLPGAPAKEEQPRLLLVDDDLDVLQAYQRALSYAGYHCTLAPDGAAALREIERQRFDLVVSDVRMPGLDGVSLLRRVRESDLDLPVILISGAPTLDAAMGAVELGASRFLAKPIELSTLRDAVSHAVQLGRLARLKRDALELLGNTDMLVGDRAGVEVSFRRALETLNMVYQPIVRWSTRTVFAHEALVRAGEPSLPTPGALFDAAERLGRVYDLGRQIRSVVAQRAASEPPGLLFFVNLHARDLEDATLRSADAPLAPHAARVVFELTERTSLEEVRDARMVVDELGAGYAGLSSFATLEPEFVKLDLSLVRGIDANVLKRRLVESMIATCGQLGVEVVAEGVETTAERDALLELGCDLFQGYLFARPHAQFPDVAW